MRKEIWFVFVMLLLGISSILFGDSLWESLGISNVDLKNRLTLTASIFFLLAGTLFTFYKLFYRIRDEINSHEQKLLSQFKETFGGLHLLSSYPGNDGIQILANKLKNTRKVLNVRVIPKEYTGLLYDNETRIWNKEIVLAVKDGLYFEDIVSGPGIIPAEKIYSDLDNIRNSIKGAYKLVELDFNLRSFLNFKIFYLKDNSIELWFGWRISDTTSIDEPCFMSNEPTLIKLFKDLHNDLARSAKSSDKIKLVRNPNMQGSQ